MPRRRYSDSERAEALAALAANAGNRAKTARQLGIPRQTLAEWVAAGELAPGVPELRQEKKAALADRLEALAHRLVDALPDKIGSASLQACAVSLGIAVEKMRLLREQPTRIDELELVPHEQLNPDELEAELVRLFAPVESAEGEAAADGPGEPAGPLVAGARGGPAPSGGPLAG